MLRQDRLENPWHKKAQWIFTCQGIGVIFVLMTTVLAIKCFYVDFLYLFNNVTDRYFKVNSSCRNATADSKNCPGSGSGRKQSYDSDGLQERVASFFIGQSMFIVMLGLLISVARFDYEKSYLYALRRNCGVSKEMERRLRTVKADYLKVKRPGMVPERTRLVTPGEFGLHKFLSEEVMQKDGHLYYEVKENMEDFILRGPSADPPYVFIDVIEWINDMLNMVVLLHEQRVFHLNLQPRTLHLHWLKPSSKCCVPLFPKPSTVSKEMLQYDEFLFMKDQKHVIFDDFKYAVKSEHDEVLVSQLGIPRHYMPPECFRSELIDARKLDSWCVGIIAFELLTGGQLMVHLSQNPAQVTCSEILSNILTKQFVSTALQERFKLFSRFLKIRFQRQTFPIYTLDQTVFASDCWYFVKCLLRFDPVERYSVEDALDLPLMRRLKNCVEKTYFIDCPLFED